MSKSFMRTLLLVLVFGIAAAVIGLMLGGSTSLYFARGSWKPQVNRYNPEAMVENQIDAFKHITLNTGSMDVSIQAGDGYKVAYDSEVASYELRGDTLTFSSKDIDGRTYMGIMAFGMHVPVTITVPGDAKLGKLDLQTSAGQLRLTDIVADDIDIETRAGGAVLRHVQIGKFDAQAQAGTIVIETAEIDEAQIETRAGGVRMSDAHVEKKLDVNTRAGSVRAEGSFKGDISIETTAGSITFITDLPYSAYRIDPDGNMGRVTGGDEDDHDAPNTLSISSQVGEMNVRFAE